MDRVDTLIDHNAALQRQVNALADQLAVLALAGLALCAACALLGWQVWHAE
jgi:hypothetical protein